MRVLLFFALFSLMPALASAQLVFQNGKPVGDDDGATASRPVADDGKGPVEAVIQGTNFPAAAITEVGDGRTSTEPVNTATRKIIDSDNPLWPTDTVDIFVSACATNKHQLVPFCRCVIERLAVKMPHNDFVMLSEADRIESDPRYIAARESCTPREERAK